MRNYLSFGGGVNSVALHLLLLEQGVDFESVFSYHGGDWPETYNYVAGFQWWLKKNGHRPITILKPDIGTVEKERFSNIYDFYKFKKCVPSVFSRICTKRFKIEVIHKYAKKPCFMMIGIDKGEEKRAKIKSDGKIEYRWPLLEQEICREGCKEIIHRYSLPLPIKSGCYFCPFQSISQWKSLRISHPDLFCKAEKLEQIAAERATKNNRKPYFLNGNNRIRLRINENQLQLFEQDEYPPCECGL